MKPKPTFGYCKACSRGHPAAVLSRSRRCPPCEAKRVADESRRAELRRFKAAVRALHAVEDADDAARQVPLFGPPGKP